jgi:hypothetical protein
MIGGCLIVGPILENYGRKIGLLLASFLSLAGKKVHVTQIEPTLTLVQELQWPIHPQKDLTHSLALIKLARHYFYLFIGKPYLPMS